MGGEGQVAQRTGHQASWKIPGEGPGSRPGRTPGNWEQVLEVDRAMLPAGVLFLAGKGWGEFCTDRKDSLGWCSREDPKALLPAETSSFPQIPFSLETEEPGIRDDFGA